MDTSDIEGQALANTSCCGGHGPFSILDYRLLNICLRFKFFFFEIVVYCLLAVRFFFGCALLLRWGVGNVCLCFVFHKHGVVRTACVTAPCTFLAVGLCLAVMAVVYFVLL